MCFHGPNCMVPSRLLSFRGQQGQLAVTSMVDLAVPSSVAEPDLHYKS